MHDRLDAADGVGMTMSRGAGVDEHSGATGIYNVECFRGEALIWKDKIHNTVMTEGKNTALNAYLSGAAYTTTGPFVGLISSTSFTAISSADTAAQLAGTNGWREAGTAQGPSYSGGGRKTPVWAAASGGSKAFNAPLVFSVTGTGTVKGAFLVYGTGASSTYDTTTGQLYSAGLFSGGDRAVLSGDTLNISYTTSL